MKEDGMSMNGRRFLPAVVIGVTLAIGILIGSLASRGVRAGKVSPLAADAKPLPAPSPVELSNSFAKIAEDLEPAVVNINTETTVRVFRKRTPGQDDSPYDDFFDRFFHFGPPDGFPGDYRQQSLGSGVILDKNGYILTNHHVITQSGEEKTVDRINVYLHGDDNTKHKARVVGTDRWTDLAVIKIDANRPLPTAQFGDSDSMRVGDWVLAIGSPFTLEGTVTAGIISAKGRDIEGGPEGQFKRFLQTDAAINPGNSGGPLVNLAGQVVGINTAIATRRGAYDGVGFAIPSNTARKVYNSLISTGSVRRGAIGVTFSSSTNPALLRSFRTDHGIVIQSVEPGTPAAHAGLMRGDVILAVDGKPISTGDELVSIVSDSEIGRKLKLDFLRDGKNMSTEVEVGDRNKIVGELRGRPGEEGGEEPAEEGGGVMGVAVRNLPREQAQDLADQLHLEGRQGVIVMDVKPGSFAADLMVQRGDVILSLNRKPVASVEDFNRLQGQLKSGQDVLLLIARRNMQRGFSTYFLADRLP
jgi:serine protease Do